MTEALAAALGALLTIVGGLCALRLERRNERIDALREAYAQFFAGMHQSPVAESFDAERAWRHEQQLTEWRVRLLERDPKARALIQQALHASNDASASFWHQSMHNSPMPPMLVHALDALELYVRERD